jgi:ABC-type multidrug transport system ATPase subunit
MDIRIESLTKTYAKGAPPALDNVDLRISSGTFGLLGPNGAGKTTLIKILSTQMEATSGEVTIDGLRIGADRATVRERLGYLPQHFGAYPKLTAFEFLDYMGRLAHIHPAARRKEAVEAALEAVALTDVRDKQAGTFSGGMTRRLGIAQAILADPAFLIVDEPTVGLDPEERIRFRKILGRLSRDRAILISTHIVGDISSTCEEIAVLNFGRLLFHGRPEELVREAENKTWTLRVDDAGFAEVSRSWHVVTVNPEDDLLAVRIVGDGAPPPGAEAAPPNLEDAYIYFMALDGDSPEGNGSRP